MVLFLSSTIYAQDLVEDVTVRGTFVQGKRVYKLYYCASCYEGGIQLTLYTDSSYFYKLIGTGHKQISEGKWTRNKKDFILNSRIKQHGVPIKIDGVSYGSDLGGITSRKTPFIIPFNLNGEKIYDARVFINNDSTFCFPYFDTCVGKYKSIDSIKVNFGKGFTTQWIPFVWPQARYVKVTAMMDFSFEEYVVFENKKYTPTTSLKLISE